MKVRCSTCGALHEIDVKGDLSEVDCPTCHDRNLQQVADDYGLVKERKEKIKRWEDREGGDI